MTDTLEPDPPQQTSSAQTLTAEQESAKNLIKITLLVSGIFNALSAVTLVIVGLLTIIFIIGCFILPFAAAPGVLAFFEIKSFMALNDPSKPQPTKRRLNLIAILEICTIIFSNVPGLICGVISITQLKNYPDDAPAA